jgi:subtilisin
MIAPAELERWRSLLHDPASNGAGVRVAVIDTGIDRELIRELHPRSLTIEGVCFTADEPRPRPDGDRASGPHGTVVADILLRGAPACQLYSIDVFGATGNCEVEALARAIEFAVHDA